MRLRFREGVQRQKRFKELFVCACRCCKTAALCLCRAEVKLIISLFRSPLGPYWVGKTQDAANCFLPTCINVDADWDAELWCWSLLIGMLLSDLLSRILHAYSASSQRKAPFSSQTGFLSFQIYFLGTLKAWIYYRSITKNPKALDALCV